MSAATSIADLVAQQLDGSQENIQRGCARIRRLLRCLALLLALVQSVVARNSIGPDGRSYLEIAQAYLRHDWAMTVTGHWGPLYSWLLAATLGIARPTLRWEFPAAHALNFITFVACMGAFEFFWSSALRFREKNILVSGHHGSAVLPTLELWVLGYALFIWLAVGVLVPIITPDLCIATVALFQAGILTRIKTDADGSLGLWGLFGFMLGVGYLIKAVMLPVGCVFLAVAFYTPSWRRLCGRCALASAVFLAVMLPQIAVLSRSVGHLTFSETGKLAFLWYNYDLPLMNWQGSPAGSGMPLHTTRKLYEHPSVFEFNGPIRASYPPWYDPSYWDAGMSHRFDLREVVRHTIPRILETCVFFVQPKTWLIGILVLLIGANLRATGWGVLDYWFLALPSLCVLVMYSLTWVEHRYLVPWELFLWGAVLFGVRLRPRFAQTRAPRCVAFLVALILLFAIAHGAYGQLVHGRRDDATPEYATAEGVQKLGLKPGTAVAAIGFDNDAHWAYLAKFSIVAEITSGDACEFWRASLQSQADVLQKFADAGAAAVVANLGGGITSTRWAHPPDMNACAHPGIGWKGIEGTPNKVYRLR